MKLFIRAFTLFSFCYFSASLTAQQVGSFMVKGVVKDSVTQETLPYSNIFFSGTTFGTISDRQGSFSLKADEPGTYELIISFTGYEMYRQKIDLNQPRIVRLEVNLKPKTRDLEAVTITGDKDRKWKRQLREFKQTFLGISRNARDCKILNEEAIYFDYNQNDDILEAFADEPLIIENRSLGYQLTYILEDFKIFGQLKLFTFYGHPSFKALAPEPKMSRRWELARNMAYFGSKNHFLRSLYQGTTQREGFAVSQAIEMDGQIIVVPDDEFVVDSLTRFDQDGLRKELLFKNYLHINYLNEVPEEIYLSTLPADASEEMRLASTQITWFEMPKGIEKLVFEQSGYWVNSIPFTVMGYWGFEKVADLLPTNYQPTR